MIYRSKFQRMARSLNWSHINYEEQHCDSVKVALYAMIFKLQLVFLKIMWLFGLERIIPPLGSITFELA